jgi:hypothetical protein
MAFEGIAVILIIVVIFLYALLTTLYIFAAGSIGLFVVKRRLPMIYPSGVIVVKGYDSGYVELDYASYKDKLKWGSILGKKDKRITHIGKPQNKERGTGIPILFAKEGEISNFDPFNSREPEKGSELFSEIAIAEYAAGYNEARQKFEKPDNLAVIAVVLSALCFIGIFFVLVMIFGQLDISNQVLSKIDGIRPAVEEAVNSALQNISRIE